MLLFLIINRFCFDVFKFGYAYEKGWMDTNYRVENCRWFPLKRRIFQEAKIPALEKQTNPILYMDDYERDLKNKVMENGNGKGQEQIPINKVN